MNKEKHTILLFAIEDEDIQMVRQIIEENLDLLKEVIGANGRTPLHLAAYHRANINQVMIDLGAEIDIDNPGYTPLFNAVRDGPFETVELLLSHGANPNYQAGESTPLFTAAMSRNPEREKIVETLVAHGAVWDLHSAIAVRNDEMSRRLLSEDPKCLENAPFSSRILGIAVWPGSPIDIVESILSLGANPDGARGDVSPLVRILGLSDCDPKMVELLLSHGANPNALTASGNTALSHYKKNHNDQAIIDLLVRYGARE